MRFDFRMFFLFLLIALLLAALILTSKSMAGH